MTERKDFYKARDITKDFNIAYSTVKSDITRYHKFDKFIENGEMYKRGNSWLIPAHAVEEVYGERIDRINKQEEIGKTFKYMQLIERINLNLMQAVHLVETAPAVLKETPQDNERFAKAIMPVVAKLYVEKVKSQGDNELPNIFSLCITEKHTPIIHEYMQAYSTYLVAALVENHSEHLASIPKEHLERLNIMLQVLLKQISERTRVENKDVWKHDYAKSLLNTHTIALLKTAPIVRLLEKNTVDFIESLLPTVREIENISEESDNDNMLNGKVSGGKYLPPSVSKLKKDEILHLLKNIMEYQVQERYVLVATAIKKYGKPFVLQNVHEAFTPYDIEYSIFSHTAYASNKKGKLVQNFELLLENASPYKEKVYEKLTKQMIPATVAAYQQEVSYEQSVWTVDNEQVQVSHEEFKEMLEVLVDIWCGKNIEKYVAEMKEMAIVKHIYQVFEAYGYQEGFKHLASVQSSYTFTLRQALIFNTLARHKVEDKNTKDLVFGTPELFYNVSLSKGELIFGLTPIESSYAQYDYEDPSLKWEMKQLKDGVRSIMRAARAAMYLLLNPLLNSYNKEVFKEVTLKDILEVGIYQVELIDKYGERKAPFETRNLKRMGMYIDTLVSYRKVDEKELDTFMRENLPIVLEKIGTDVATSIKPYANSIFMDENTKKYLRMMRSIKESLAKSFTNDAHYHNAMIRCQTKMLADDKLSLRMKWALTAMIDDNNRPFIHYLSEKYPDLFALSASIHVEPKKVDIDTFLNIKFNQKAPMIQEKNEKTWRRLDYAVAEEIVNLVEKS